MTTVIDLAHPISDGMAAYPGLPAARVRPLLTHDESRDRYDGQAEFCLTSLELAGNTGTYLDSPWHRHRGGLDVAGIPLARVAALPAVVLDPVPGGGAGRGVDVQVPRDVAGAAVLVRTGWSSRWGTPGYWEGGPHLSAATVAALVSTGPALVGVDFANVDDPGDPARPAHTDLLGADIVLVEHLTGLERLPGRGSRFHCAPLAVVGAASVPVRPYAVLEELG